MEGYLPRSRRPRVNRKRQVPLTRAELVAYNTGARLATLRSEAIGDLAHAGLVPWGQLKAHETEVARGMDPRLWWRWWWEGWSRQQEEER